MVYSLIWLPDILKSAGLKVASVDGWENRGHDDVEEIVGVICHHTAGPKTGNMPSLGIVTNGRPDLSGPLSQLCLGRDGTFYVVAAGKAYHAGAGKWQEYTGGNSNFIGIEAENTGLTNDPWPAVQIDAYRRGVAAILKHIGQNESMCAGHKEYALPLGRKTDPSFDMHAFRTAVADILNGKAPPPTLIPAVETANNSGNAPRPTLRRGANGDLVKILQGKLQIVATGNFGPETESAVRIFQTNHNLVPDGIVGPKTWLSLDEV